MKHTIENLLIKSPKLLVIDDDIAQLAQITAWLSEHEGAVFQARSSEQAQKILKKNPIDAVITDWQLPEKSGLELIQELREAGFKGPLLICTGLMLSPEHLQQAFEVGASDYLRKPLNHVELKSRLDKSFMLYAQHKILQHQAQSQTRLIHFLSQGLGQSLEQLAQLQAQHLQAELSESVHNALSEDLAQQFRKAMLWAQYRFSLQYVQFSRVELKALLKSLVQDFAEASHRLFFRGGKGLILYTEADILQRILWQLLDNALRYNTGPVILKVSVLEQGVRIAVQDAGQSLNEGDLARLLNGEKSGLGLEICQDLLSLLGSELQAQLLRDGGCRFFFDLGTSP